MKVFTVFVIHRPYFRQFTKNFKNKKKNIDFGVMELEVPKC